MNTGSRILRSLAFAALLALGTACHSYGGKAVEVGLTTNPPLTGPSQVNDEAYVISIEDWAKALSQFTIQGKKFDWPEMAPPQAFVPDDPLTFNATLERWRVHKLPPVDVWVEPYQSIYAVRLFDNRYYWIDFTPSFDTNNPNNLITLEVSPDAWQK